MLRVRTVSSAEGVVAGAPRRWLGLEGLVLLAGALIAFGALGQPWWLVPAEILAPDIAMSGYLAGTRPGAHLYNLTHATLLPAVMLGAGYWQANRLVMALALVWLAHIGPHRPAGQHRVTAHPASGLNRIGCVMPAHAAGRQPGPRRASQHRRRRSS